ncbi:MAG: hypothetical protein HQ523_07700 [Lentisphaerae bacterium]|nr:hypothetical protein [Lentisphaerota bacterium]
MNDQKQPNPSLAGPLAFATAVLGAVHMLTFVWLTAFVYQDNVRGYVPAGITGLTVLAVATFCVIAYLAVVRRKDGRPTAYLPVGCLGALLGLFAASAYCGILLRVLGYSLQKDIGISVTGAVLFTAVAVIVHKKKLTKRADNNNLKGICR